MIKEASENLNIIIKEYKLLSKVNNNLLIENTFGKSDMILMNPEKDCFFIYM